jgi:hypothetical protein
LSRLHDNVEKLNIMPSIPETEKEKVDITKL